MNKLIFTFILVFSLGACGSARFHETPASSLSALPGDDRRVEQSAQIKVEVKDIVTAEKALQKKITELGGYTRNANKDSSESSYLLISIPPKQMIPLLDHIAGLGKELSRSINSNDVTMQYIDLKAKLDNLKALRERLKKLLDKSNDIEKLLDVEKEVARVQTEIDRITATLKHLQRNTSETTVAANLQKKHRRGPVALIGYAIAYVGRKLVIWD